VEAGSACLLSKIFRSLGTTTVIITIITPITTTIIIAGYMSAALSFQEIEATFSIWSARLVRTSLSFPVFSPERTTPTSAAEKEPGYKSIHSERFFPSLRSLRNLSSIFLKTGFFSCFSNTHTPFKRGIPALSIVDISRKNITFSLIFRFWNFRKKRLSFS